MLFKSAGCKLVPSTLKISYWLNELLTSSTTAISAVKVRLFADGLRLITEFPLLLISAIFEKSLAVKIADAACTSKAL